MESHSDTGNMVHESKMPEPLAMVAQFMGEWRETVSVHAQPVYTAAQMREYAQEATRQAMERAEAAIIGLRDSHCADTQKLPAPEYACTPDSVSCDLVVAWNDAIAAIRALTPADPTGRELRQVDADAARWRFVRANWGKLSEVYEGEGAKVLEMRVVTEADGFDSWDVDPDSLDAAVDRAAAQLARAADAGGKEVAP